MHISLRGLTQFAALIAALASSATVAAEISLHFSTGAQAYSVGGDRYAGRKHAGRHQATRRGQSGPSQPAPPWPK